MNKYSIQNEKTLPENYTIYDFQNIWDKKSIKKAVDKSRNKIPLFCLSKIEIHPAGICNQNCKICYGKLLAPKKRVNLSAKNINSLLLDIRKNMPDENPLIILSGLYSEPLTNPKIKEILKYIGDYNFRFGLYTNGLLMDDEIIEILIRNSLNSKSMRSFISFNITSSLLSGDFEKLIKIIKKLSIKRKSESSLQINAPILIVKPDYKLLKNRIQKLILAGANTIRLSSPLPQFVHNKKVKNTHSNKDHKEIYELIEKLHKQFPDRTKARYNQPKKTFNKCCVMAMSSAISPEGNVYPCPETCSPFFRQLSYGSIKKQKFSKIWQGLKHQEIFKTLNPKSNGCRCCIVDAMFNKFCENISIQKKFSMLQRKNFFGVRDI